MIELKNICKVFRKDKDFFAKEFHALSNVSFSIGENEIIGFLGANGAGKTTTNKILMGFIPQSSGEIQFSKEMGQNYKEVRGKIGYLPERPYFYPHLSGRAFLDYLGNLSGLNKNFLKNQISNWSQKLKIDHSLDNKIRNYSKGMLQRLGLVSVLIHDPKLIILDEPLSGLDPIGRMDIKNIILELHKEGKTIFFSSHIVSDVEAICKKVVFLEQGELIYEGSIDKIIHDNNHNKYEVQCLSKNEVPLSLEPIHKENDLSIFEIDKSKKRDFLSELSSKDFELISLKQLKPSLEDVIYKVRAQK